MKDIPLNPQQVEFFRVFGFLQLPGLMAHKIDRIIADFEAVFAARGGGHGGKPHEGKARSAILPFIDQHEGLCALLDDPHIHGVITSLLGDDFNYLSSDGNYYVGDTPWHSDGRHALKHMKLAMYFDPVDRNTGALRVIPGSHKMGDRYGEALNVIQDKGSNVPFGIDGRDVPSYSLDSKPGDVVVFDSATKHASYGGSNRRRMMAINLSQRYPEDRVIDLKTNIIDHFARFWLDRMYGERMIKTATPQRMRHLEQVMANDGHLAELSRKARQSMTEPSRG